MLGAFSQISFAAAKGSATPEPKAVAVKVCSSSRLIFNTAALFAQNSSFCLSKNGALRLTSQNIPPKLPFETSRFRASALHAERWASVPKYSQSNRSPSMLSSMDI